MEAPKPWVLPTLRGGSEYHAPLAAVAAEALEGSDFLPLVVLIKMQDTLARLANQAREATAKAWSEAGRQWPQANEALTAPAEAGVIDPRYPAAPAIEAKIAACIAAIRCLRELKAEVARLHGLSPTAATQAMGAWFEAAEHLQVRPIERDLAPLAAEFQAATQKRLRAKARVEALTRSDAPRVAVKAATSGVVTRPRRRTLSSRLSERAHLAGVIAALMRLMTIRGN